MIMIHSLVACLYIIGTDEKEQQQVDDIIGTVRLKAVAQEPRYCLKDRRSEKDRLRLLRKLLRLTRGATAVAAVQVFNSQRDELSWCPQNKTSGRFSTTTDCCTAV